MKAPNFSNDLTKLNSCRHTIRPADQTINAPSSQYVPHIRALTVQRLRWLCGPALSLGPELGQALGMQSLELGVVQHVLGMKCRPCTL